MSISFFMEFRAVQRRKKQRDRSQLRKGRNGKRMYELASTTPHCEKARGPCGAEPLAEDDFIFRHIRSWDSSGDNT